jgi:hypothetical protein
MREKASLEASGRDQEGVASQLMKCRKPSRWHQNRGARLTLGRVWRVPAYWSDDARHEGGVSLICCFRVEREKACSDTALRMLEGEREPPKRLKP